MEIEIVDMHCHLLPKVDDGAKDIKDTIRALRMATEQGVKKIIMTPHFRPDSHISPERVLKLTAKVNDIAKSENINLDLFAGMECMYFGGLPSLLERGEVLPLAGSRYVLVEFPWEVTSLQIEVGFERIFEVGYIPILAHYERYRSLKRDGVLEHFKAKGYLLQMNYDTISQRYGLLRCNPFLKDIKNGWVSFLGSDCHGSNYRKYSLNTAVAWLKRNIPQDKFSDMIYNNPLKIIDNNLFTI